MWDRGDAVSVLCHRGMANIQSCVSQRQTGLIPGVSSGELCTSPEGNLGVSLAVVEVQNICSPLAG